MPTKGDRLKADLREKRDREARAREKLRHARRSKAPGREVRGLRKVTMLFHRRALAAERELARYRHYRHMPLRLRALEQARALIGVMEQGGNNTGPVVDKIILANGGMIGEAWCGDTMAFVYRLAGSRAVQRNWAAVRLIGFLSGMRIVSDPRPGDLVVYTFDHVGMFEKDLGAKIQTIEGNTGATGAVSDSSTGGDGVYRKERDKSLVARYVRVTR